MAADNEARSVLCDLALPSYIRLYKLILLEQQRKNTSTTIPSEIYLYIGYLPEEKS